MQRAMYAYPLRPYSKAPERPDVVRHVDGDHAVVLHPRAVVRMMS
ncbi:uncharacterized protein CMC5_024430 [Chondromyces crocatus]|uniref:Uncharacterized protein n=1 Tax=Chondromyces crocatus TaxID=52 RepID=A0A0K1ECI9_CHOCO|nr:uncharacterized protein CMC5_024430 [Chondromyces crocatus]